MRKKKHEYAKLCAVLNMAFVQKKKGYSIQRKTFLLPNSVLIETLQSAKRENEYNLLLNQLHKSMIKQIVDVNSSIK